MAWVYHAKNIKVNMSLIGHGESCTCGEFSNDGKFLLTASEDMTLRVWELKSSTTKHTIRGKKYHKSHIISIAVAKTKALVATGGAENEVGLVNYELGTVKNNKISKIVAPFFRSR